MEVLNLENKSGFECIHCYDSNVCTLFEDLIGDLGVGCWMFNGGEQE